MAVEDALSLAGSILDDPLKADLVSLFSGLADSGPTLMLGSRILTAGEVELVVGDFVTLGVFPFRPSVGFDSGRPLESKMTVKVPHLADRSISLSTGAHILCAGTPSCNQQDYIEHEDDVVTFRPEFDKLMPWNMFHSFAGAYSGWAQAADFLDRTEAAFCLGQEFELDINEQVMQLWSVKHTSKPLLVRALAISEACGGAWLSGRLVSGEHDSSAVEFMFYHVSALPVVVQRWKTPWPRRFKRLGIRRRHSTGLCASTHLHCRRMRRRNR